MNFQFLDTEGINFNTMPQNYQYQYAWSFCFLHEYILKCWFFSLWISWKTSFSRFLERVVSHFRLNIISEIVFSCCIKMILLIFYKYSVPQILAVYALCTMQIFLTPFHRQKYILWCDLVNTRRFVTLQHFSTTLNFTK